MIRFELTTPVLDDRPVYVSGNFCDWYPEIAAFRMQPVEAGRYVLHMPATLKLPDVIEYKYTRGGWDQVELDAAGDVPPNRVSTRKKGIQRDSVPHWRWYGHGYNPDYLPTSRLLQAEFPTTPVRFPRLVRVLLPYNYESSTKRYPVLYLQDGQNLIGSGSEYGSWEVDRRMAVLASRYHHDIILVVIDHAAENRVKEFTPDRTMAGTGDGRQYLDFVANTLKPVIDQTYRTIPDPNHTGLGGSSMGGLISTYGGLLFPNVFGRLMIFSPSYWAAPNLNTDIRQFERAYASKWYLYGGGKESRTMVSSMKQVSNWLQWASGRQPIEVTLSIQPKGQHSESYWGHEFPTALEWLFY